MTTQSSPEASPLTWNYKMSFTLGMAILYAAVLIGCAIHYETDISVSLMLGTTACLFGWLIAIISSPYDDKDKGNIASFSKLIGTFLSGYILSKLDHLLTKILDPVKLLDNFNPVVGLRTLFFTSFFLMSFIVTYVFRMYVPKDIKAVESNGEKKSEVSKG